MVDRHEHWEKVYQTKQQQEVSWFQPTPVTSLQFFKKFKVPLTARIIDVGGGDSLLVDHLLELGYQNITVLDISETAITKAKARLGAKAGKIHWIVTDITQFQPSVKYDFWHDRATFHFLTEEKEIEAYVRIARASLVEDGLLVVGTFSDKGPEKCSGLTIRQYTELSHGEPVETLF